ncbi:hypothetical protein OK016_27305 [Vibrio chagasii]|nr:hypothetical protein [Vibrio chagasii]
MIGNVRWPTTGEVIASSDIEGSVIPELMVVTLQSLPTKKKELILGGEITMA